MVFMPHWPKILGHRPNPIDFDKNRMREILSRLDNPQDKLPPVIHVAGTNGKGSTIAILQAILEAAGKKTDVYTSPHLLNFNERIVLGGKPISDNALYQIMEECRLACEGIDLTFFEGTTAGGFLAFSRSDADILLLETGMGGRLDCTNMVKQPLATIITPISLDHTDFLGDTLLQIAYEKACIMKKETPSFISLQHEQATEVLEAYAKKIGAPLFSYGDDFGCSRQDDTMIYRDENHELLLPLPALQGDHQILNATTAIACLLKCQEGLVDEMAIKTGLENVSWPGRLQQITAKRLLSELPEKSEIWIDGAHNAASAAILSNALEDFPSDLPLYLVCGVTKGRDPKEILAPFQNQASHVSGILVQTEPCAAKPDTIAAAAAELGFENNAVWNVMEALETINAHTTKPCRVVFMGSLYLVSDVLKEA